MPEVGRYSSVIEALIARVTGHNVTGGILADFKWVQLPVKEPSGKDDLPSLRLFMPDPIKEKAQPQLTVIDGGTMVLKLTVSTLLSEGLAAHLAAIESVLDAIEIDPETDALDLLLSDTLTKPMDVTACANPFMPENGFSTNSHILLTVTPKPRVSGGRRLA